MMLLSNKKYLRGADETLIANEAVFLTTSRDQETPGID
jgi:hypothetical protein